MYMGRQQRMVQVPNVENQDGTPDTLARRYSLSLCYFSKIYHMYMILTHSQGFLMFQWEEF